MGAVPGAVAPAAIDWPELRRIGIEGLVDLMRTVPDPTRTESALELCRHVEGVKEVYATEARPIIAEACEIVGAHLEEREGRLPKRCTCTS
jgi:hypothetical protein